MAAPRARLDRDPAMDVAGNVLSSASVTVYDAATGSTLFPQPMYSASSGGALLANPFSSGANGAVDCYTQYPRKCWVSVNGGARRPANFVANQDLGDHGLGPYTAISFLGFADPTGATAISQADLNAFLDACVAEGAEGYIPAGTYDFSTVGFTISSTYNGLTLRCHKNALIQARDTALTFAVEASRFKIVGGQWTRKGTTAATYNGHLMLITGDDSEFHPDRVYNLGGYGVKGAAARVAVSGRFEECGLNNRSALTNNAPPAERPKNLHPEPAGAILFQGVTDGKITDLWAIGCGGPTINMGSGGGGNVIDNVHLIGTARTSTATVTTIQGGTGSVNEIQRLTISAGCKTGVVYLQFGVDATPIVPIDYTAAEWQAEMEILPSIGTGNISVTGAFPTWDFEFIGALGHTNVAQMTTSSHYLDQQENGIYDTGGTGNQYSNLVVKNFSNEGILLSGGNSRINGLRISNDVLSNFSIGVAFYPDGPWTITNIDADFLNVAQGIVTTGVGTVNNVTITGASIEGGKVQLQAATDGFILSDGVGWSGFQFAANSGLTMADLNIADFTFSGFSDSSGAIIAGQNLTVTNVTFNGVVAAAGLFERLAADRQNITVTNCRTVGSVAGIKALVYGSNVAGGNWVFTDCDFGFLPPSTTSTGSVVPFTVSPPWVGRRLEMGRVYEGYAVLDSTSSPQELDLCPSIIGRSTVAPITATVTIVGAASGSQQAVQVTFIKLDATTLLSAAIVNLAGTAGTIFVLGDFTDSTSATSLTLTPHLTTNTIAAIGRFRWRVEVMWG